MVSRCKLLILSSIFFAGIYANTHDQVEKKYNKDCMKNLRTEISNRLFRESYKLDLASRIANKALLSRALITLSGKDTDYIPKVARAGEIFNEDNSIFQLMHNGIKIEVDCYYGEESPWMTEIIKGLQGHHEPQEEKVFFEVLKCIPKDATIVELGSYWGYYSLWFLQGYPLRKAYLVEPDISRLEVGKRNFFLNGLSGKFFQYYIGKKESDSVSYTQDIQIGVDEFIKKHNIPHINILHSDIQGAEYLMLLSSLEAIEENKIDYFFISTHGDIVHNQCLSFLHDRNFCIVADHRHWESYSYDGLIVAKRAGIYGPDKVEISKNITSEFVF